jgi:Sulfotransferase family
VNPYVFFVGCPRSGTTLVQRIANAHPLLAVVNEQEWIANWWEQRVGVAPDGTVTPELVEKLFSHRRFPRLGLEPERVADLVRDEQKHYVQFVVELFDLHGRAEGKPLVGEKSPGYVKHLATMHELFPQARFVHLIRDGRDVALSALAWKKAERSLGRYPTWQDDPLSTAAIWWEWHVRLGRETGASLGPDLYYELRYESLVHDPDEECRKLCGFLDVPYEEAMLRFHEGRTRTKPGLGAKASWLPVTPGLRSWRRQMPTQDVARFEAACGPLLRELGYATGARAVSEAELERAMRLRAAFAVGALSRGRATPEAWTGVAA